MIKVICSSTEEKKAMESFFFDEYSSVCPFFEMKECLKNEEGLPEECNKCIEKRVKILKENEG